MPIWIAVVDSSRGRIFAAPDREGEWDLVQTLDHPDSRLRTSEMMSDNEGHSAQHRGYARSDTEPRTAPDEVEDQKFAREVADLLEQGFDRRSYDELVVVAPPDFLGKLRQALPSKVSKVVSNSINRELTQLPERELVERLRPELVGVA